jgi:hypothetical protein
MPQVVVNLTDIPVRRLGARRRRAKNVVWIISDNYYYSINPNVDLVWELADGTNSIKTIAQKVAISKRSKMDVALATAAAAVCLLSQHGLLDLANGSRLSQSVGEIGSTAKRRRSNRPSHLSRQ